MILNSSQFVGPIIIEGIHDNSSSAKVEDLNYYINLYENEYLKMILGPLCDEFVSSDEGKWRNLKDFLSKDCSPLARYVFFHYTRSKPFSSTPTGTKTEGVSPYNLCVKTWNDAIPQNRKVLELLSSGEYEGFEFDYSLLSPIW